MNIRKLQKIALYLLLLVLGKVSNAQVFTMNNGAGSVACGSTASFYDSGGPTGSYTNGQNYTFTVCPSATGTALSVIISSFVTQSANDKLIIYDGLNTTAQVIVTLSGSTSTTGTFTSSTYNTTGCLTFQFISDNAGGATATNSAGWSSIIKCASPVAPPKNADCVTKKTFCGGIAAFTDGNNGAGATDLTAANEGCLSGETQSAWYAFTAGTAGNIVFTITPAGATDDIDFGIWGPNSACPPTGTPKRCSAVCPKQSGSACCGGLLGNPCTSAAPTVLVGLKASETDVSEAGGASGGDGFLMPLAVLPGETYILMVNNASSSTQPFTMDFSGSTAAFQACPTVILPVTFLDFTTLLQADQVHLVWQTATEENTAYFQVERSQDGLEFENVGGHIAAAGNSSSLRLYTLVDDKPKPGTSYYRIRELDANGKANLSDIEVIKTNIEALKILNIYPNPVSKTEALEAELLCNLPVLNLEISIQNILGQTIYRSGRQMTGGYNKISMPVESLDLKSGVYFLQLISGANTLSQKIIIQ